MNFSSIAQSLQSVVTAINAFAKTWSSFLPGGGSSLVSGAQNTTAATTTLLIAAQAGKSIYVRGYSVGNTSATPMVVNFQDGSGGTTLWSVVLAAGASIALNEVMPMFKTSSGNGLYFQASAGVTTLYVSAAGFAA